MVTGTQKRVSSRPRLVLNRNIATRDALKRPLAHDFTLQPARASSKSAEYPRRVQLLRPDPTDPSRDQLLLDRVPVPRDAWTHDERHGTLTWRGAFGGGHLHLDRQRRSGVGNVGDPLSCLAVTAGLTSVFDCDVALNAGATLQSQGSSVTGFAWDPTSAAWSNANWIIDRLQLSYSVTSNGPLAPPAFTFTFTDNQTQAIPWIPSLFTASMQLGARSQQGVWELTFKSEVSPDPDQGNPATGPDTVYPYMLQADEDMSGVTIDGAMLIDGDATSGTVVALRGVRHNSMLAGYYRLNATSAPFGVFDGRLVVGGKPHPQSRIRNDELTWSGLPPAQQARTGLSASGSLQFQKDGSGAIDRQRGIGIQRLSTSTAIASLKAHSDFHPDIAARLDAQQTALDSSALSVIGLLSLTPYAQDSNGDWSDVVQTNVTKDLSTIMNSYIPSDLWNLVMSGTTQPTLTGTVGAVAATSVSGAPAPAVWYPQLATAVLTSGLAGGSDPNCKYMNGPRAKAWLGTQVGSSTLYYSHTQQLFQYEWQQLLPVTSQYLADQVINAATYAPQIQAQLQANITDIQTNVAPDSTQPTLIQDLIAQVQTDATYATTNNLYWAYAYYTYNTAPGILANIALQMAFQTGASDGMTLSRLFQQNVSVLTALDPTGYFARQYTSTINQFMGSNILPSMVDFAGPAASFNLIQLYLQQFVTNNLASEDAQIAQAAQTLKQFIADQQFEEMVTSSLQILREISGVTADALALPYISQKYLAQFTTRFPRWAKAGSFISGMIVSGVTVMGALSLIQDFDDFDNLSDKDKAQLIDEAAQLGLQIMSGVIKGSVRMYAIYAAQGITRGSLRSMGSILMRGTSDDLAGAMQRIGNRTAQWIGGTSAPPPVDEVPNDGRLNPDDDDPEPVVHGNMPEQEIRGLGNVEADQTSWLGKVFGKNLDEFVATRIGPVFIVAGIVFSLWDALSGESGIQLAGDIVNAVQGGLTLLALVGEWAVPAESALASVIGVAGPLAIVAALAGIGIMIYEMLEKPPDPVATFVDQNVKPAGFYVTNTASAIDYATVYTDVQGTTSVEMVGFTLGLPGGVLTVSSTGSISIAPATGQPSCVWTASTDGFGQSQISTIVPSSSGGAPVSVLLSLMSDGSVSFQLPMGTAGAGAGGVSIVTQTWLSSPQGDATLTADQKYLASLQLQLQPVIPDKQGNYAPAQAQGWLVQAGSGVRVSSSGGSVFTLQMAGMAPNFMTIPDLTFWVGVMPGAGQSFAPRFGVKPSPGTYSVSPPLPSFLELDPIQGTITPTQQAPSAPSNTTYTLTMTNPYGSASTTFAVKITSLQALTSFAAAA